MEKDLKLLELRNEIERIKKDMRPSNYSYDYIEGLPKKSKEVLTNIEQKYNTSWAVFMFERNKNSLNKIAILYRGHKITYEELYKKAYDYSKSLKELGIKKGDQVPACISNIPEYVYLRMACSFIGATLHMVGPWFDKEYLCKILNKTNSEIMLVSDDNYQKISEVINSSNIDTLIILSLSDSLMKDKNGKPFNPYEDIDSFFHTFDSKVKEIKLSSKKRILSQEEFISIGKKYNNYVLENVDLNDISAITYTSGTTKPGCPKGVKHTNRSYITFARFKSSDVSGMPEMKNLSGLSLIPTYSHTQLSALSDTLFCNCTNISEPFTNKEFFPYSLIINKPNYCPCPVGFWLYLAKKMTDDENFKNIKMPYLMLPEIVGEECSPGEEKYLNEISRIHKFGVGKLPFPLSPVTYTYGGGTTEGGGLFTTLYHGLQNKKLFLYNIGSKNYTLGLIPLKLCEVQILDQNGNYCGLNQAGLLVVNSPGNMLGYDDDSLNDNLYINDATGKRWLNMGTIAYKSDPFGGIKMKGRVNDYSILKSGEIFYHYIIEECISKDTKNILSCSIVAVDGKYICHIKFQPKKHLSDIEILKSCSNRLEKFVPKEILENIFYRIRDSFPMGVSGKRDFVSLANENNENILLPYNFNQDKETQLNLKLKQ